MNLTTFKYGGITPSTFKAGFGVGSPIDSLETSLSPGTEQSFYGKNSSTQDGYTRDITLDQALAQRVLAGLDPESEKRKLENTLAFQKAQMKEALPYKFISDASAALQKIPERISTDAASRAMLNVIGAESAARAFNQTMASYPKTNFQSTVPLVQRNYFT